MCVPLIHGVSSSLQNTGGLGTWPCGFSFEWAPSVSLLCGFTTLSCSLAASQLSTCPDVFYHKHIMTLNSQLCLLPEYYYCHNILKILELELKDKYMEI